MATVTFTPVGEPEPPVGSIAIPGTFNNTLSTSISWDGAQVQHAVNPYAAIDWTITEGSPNDYYVNYTEGDNANLGTSSGAGNSWKTLDYAVANASSPAIVHLEDDYIGYLSSAATVKVFTGKIKLFGEGNFNGTGRTLIAAMRESYTKAGFTWTATGGSDAYKSSTVQAKQYRSQFYLGTKDSDGIPEPMSVAASAAACESTPGTFYWDGVDTLYVHMIDGTEPDPFVNWLYTESPYDFELHQGGATSSDIALFENLDFVSNNGAVGSIGGLRYRPVTTGSETSARMGVYNCHAYGGCANGFVIFDADVVAVESCTSKYNHDDAFNYHSFVTTGTDGEYMTVYEHNCVSGNNGYDDWDDQTALGTSSNGSTAHDSMHVMRTNCTHANTNGAVVADVNGVHSVNFNVRSTLPTGTADPKACFWHEKLAGAGTTKIMYLWGCYAHDGGDGSVNLTDNTNQSGGPSNDGEIRVKEWTGQTDGDAQGGIFDESGSPTTFDEQSAARSTVAPGDPIVVSIDWAGVGADFDIYTVSALGEEHAATWDISPNPNASATFQEGFSGENPMYSDPSVVTILRAAGWDAQGGAFAVRVETFDSVGGAETHNGTYTLSSTLPIVRDDTHTATGLDRLLDQFDGSVNLRHLASSYLDQAQSFEDVAYQLINARSLAIVSGNRLDGLGQIVNVPRSGRTDEEYRLRIRAELAILLSQGTTEDLIGVLRLLLGLSSPPDIQIDEYYPKAIFMRPRNFIVEDDPATVAALLRRAASAATYLQFIYSQTENDDDDLFRFSDTNGTSETSSSHGYSNGTYTGAK